MTVAVVPVAHPLSAVSVAKVRRERKRNRVLRRRYYLRPCPPVRKNRERGACHARMACRIPVEAAVVPPVVLHGLPLCLVSEVPRKKQIWLEDSSVALCKYPLFHIGRKDLPQPIARLRQHERPLRGEEVDMRLAVEARQVRIVRGSRPAPLGAHRLNVLHDLRQKPPFVFEALREQQFPEVCLPREERSLVVYAVAVCRVVEISFIDHLRDWQRQNLPGLCDGIFRLRHRGEPPPCRAVADPRAVRLRLRRKPLRNFVRALLALHDCISNGSRSTTDDIGGYHHANCSA